MIADTPKNLKLFCDNPLRLDALSGAALGARLPGAGRRRARILLFKRRLA